jgi:hypothetical protein
MKFVNLTPHAITIRTKEGDITIEPEGTVARVDMAEHHLGLMFYKQIPVITRKRIEVVGLPPQEDRVRGNLICLVSSMVLDALEWAHAVNVYAPDTGPTAVRDEKGHVVAVTRLVCR